MPVYISDVKQVYHLILRQQFKVFENAMVLLSIKEQIKELASTLISEDNIYVTLNFMAPFYCSIKMV